MLDKGVTEIGLRAVKNADSGDCARLLGENVMLRIKVKMSVKTEENVLITSS